MSKPPEKSAVARVEPLQVIHERLMQFIAVHEFPSHAFAD
jgi:hypothetical protein